MSERQDYWNEHLLQSKKAEVSQKEYCRENKLNYNTFKYWLRKIKNGGKILKKKFHKIPINLNGSVSSEVTIILANGIQVKAKSLSDIKSVKSLITSLKEIS